MDSEKSLPPIWKFLGAKYNPPIRAAAARLLDRMSDYFISEDSRNGILFSRHIHKLSNSVFSAIADQSSHVQRILWKSVLCNFSSRFEDVWIQVDIKKGVLPQLHTCLKNTGFGAHGELYKNFSVFMSMFPIFECSSPFKSECKIEQAQSNNKVKPLDPLEEAKEPGEERKEPKKKKKGKKDKAADGPASKNIVNSFSISEKANIMFEIMKSLLSGINLEEAIAFKDEIINCFYDTMSFIYTDRVLPALDQLQKDGDNKSIEIINKKVVQCFMHPITEYLKKNDPKLGNSLYKSIPNKFASTLSELAEKGIDIEGLGALFKDIQETFTIGLERSPHNTIKILSTFVLRISADSPFYSKVQDVGTFVVRSLKNKLSEGAKNLNKDTIEQFEKDVEIFGYIAHNLLTSNLTSDIFELSGDEKTENSANPVEFNLLLSILKLVKMAAKKLKPPVLRTLEFIQEKLWLCLILRVNYLCKRD